METRSTTIVGVKHRGGTAFAGDGQVTQGSTVMKHGARKVRRLYGGRLLSGFAGTAADGMTLFERFEKRLEEHDGSLLRAAVELAKEWRTDRVLRHLEALLLVADSESMLLISGTGEIVEPDDGVAAIGSGGPYALAAARAMVAHSDLDCEEIARRSLEIAASICIYTNDRIMVEKL